MITGTLADRVAALMPQAETEPAEPPGMDPVAAQDALIKQLEASAPWGVGVAAEPEAAGAPFRARTDGPAYASLNEAMNEAMKAAYGRPYTTLGQGGSIPLCNVLADTFPDAEIILMGVEEPLTLMHAPNESVAPSEIQKMAPAEAVFLAMLGEKS